MPVIQLSTSYLGPIHGPGKTHDIEDGEMFLSTKEEGASDHGIVVLSINAGGTKEVFAGGLEAVEETTSKI